MIRLSKTLILLALISGALSASAVAEMGVCQQFFHNFKEARLRKKSGESIGNLYRSLYRSLGQGLHPDTKIKNEAFAYLKSPGVDPKILPYWQDLTHVELKTAFDKFRELPDSEKDGLLQSVERWSRWFEPSRIPPPELKLVNVDGLMIERDRHHRLLTVKSQMKKLGIETKIVAGPIIRLRNSGLLKITAIYPRATLDQILPNESIFRSKAFVNYVRLARATGGDIVIDPFTRDTDNFAAYFWENPNIVPGSAWVIALSPDSTGGYFIHEWEHKLDYIDQYERYFDSLVQNKVPDNSSGPLSQAIRQTGAELEDDFLTELNATGREIDLYFETRSFPLKNIQNTLIYRGQNARKVAIGRIFLDPLNPDHYVLYLKSRALVYIPRKRTAALTAAAVVGAIAYFNRDGEK